MSESVKIIIDADDQASRKVEAAARNVENNIKKIRATGEQAKKSTEFFGVIATSLGGSELGAFASQLGGITEKTSQFAEVQKLGGAGALAFKAGLVGAVGVVAFQFGSAIGNAIFQTEKWTERLKEASDKAKELATNAASIRQTQFTERREDIEIFQDPEQKREAYKQLLGELNKDLAGVEAQSRASKKAADEWAAAWQITGDRQGFAEQAKQQAAEDAERVKALQAQRGEIEKLLSPRAEENRLLRERQELDKQAEANVAKLKEEIDLLNGKVKVLSTEEQMLMRKRDLLKEQKQKETASDAFIKQLREEVALLKVKKSEQFAVEAGQKTSSPAKANIAAELLQERDALIQKRELEKQAAAEKENESKRIADLKKAELDKLEQERVLLTKGKEAAQAFALQKQGLSKADAERIAAEQSKLDQVNKEVAKSKQAAPNQINQAFEARLLTRGTGGGDPAQVTANNTAQLLKEQQLANRLLEEANKREMRLKVIRNN
jgi:hypothetical protein